MTLTVIIFAIAVLHNLTTNARNVIVPVNHGLIFRIGLLDSYLVALYN